MPASSSRPYKSMPITLRNAVRLTRVRDEGQEFFHSAKVAAEVARLAPRAARDIEMVRAIADEE